MTTRRGFLRGSALSAAGGLLGSLPLARAAAPLTRSFAPQRLLNGEALQTQDFNGAGSLRAHAEARRLLTGCAVIPGKLRDDPEYASLVAAQANIIVPENALKWEQLRPAVGLFNFTEADAVVAFAAAHGQRVRGHTLCWHNQLPRWFASTATPENARQLLTEHIQRVAGRYAGRMHSWDVVNEAVDSENGRSDGLRKTPWLALLGDDYIEYAFKTAHAADPQALLTYNDFDIELDTPEQARKRAKILQLVRKLKGRGTPIDALGIQSHLGTTEAPAGAGLRSFVRELRRLGLQVFITELDVNDRKADGLVPDRDQAVARVYAQYLGLMLAEPNVTAVLTWGITDRYTWVGNKDPRPDGTPPRPLPFGPDYRPAPAFFAVRDSFDARTLA